MSCVRVSLRWCSGENGVGVDVDDGNGMRVHPATAPAFHRNMSFYSPALTRPAGILGHWSKNRSGFLVKFLISVRAVSYGVRLSPGR